MTNIHLKITISTFKIAVQLESTRLKLSPQRIKICIFFTKVNIAKMHSFNICTSTKHLVSVALRNASTLSMKNLNL